jgi:hypothetical protein
MTDHDDLSAEANGAAFAARYISMLSNLPNVGISEALSDHTLFFLFDGGEGLIMSLRGTTLGTIRIAFSLPLRSTNIALSHSHLVAFLLCCTIKGAVDRLSTSPFRIHRQLR